MGGLRIIRPLAGKQTRLPVLDLDGLGCFEGVYGAGGLRNLFGLGIMSLPG